MSEEVRASIHNYFREFGSELGEAVYQELRKPGGMPKLLKRLGIPVEGDSTDHYRMLIQYFRRKGTTTFLELVGLKPLNFRIDVVSTSTNKEDDTRKRLGLKPLSSSAVPVSEVGAKQDPPTGSGNLPPADPPSTPPTPHTVRPATPAGLTPLPATPKPASPTTPKPAVSSPPLPPRPESAPAQGPSSPMEAPPNTGNTPSPYDNVDGLGFPKGPLIPAPSPSDGGANAPSWDPNKPWDPTGTWPEVERRSGRERRRKPDRRQDIDIIYSNRRFGGDRREGGERRKNWPKGGHKP